MEPTVKNESFDGASGPSEAESVRINKERASIIIKEIDGMNFDLAAETIASLLSKLTKRAKEQHPNREARMNRLFGLLESANDKAVSQ